MRLINEWDNVFLTTKKIVRLFEQWRKNNLTLTHGYGRGAEEIFGLAYTSSSEYAAIWNVQGEAVLNENPDWRFEGLALDEINNVYAIFEHEDGTIETLDRKYINIGRI